MEEWRGLPELELEVSSVGRVRAQNGTLLRQRVTTWGYLTVRFRIADSAVCRMVHRLMAEAFIPRPEGASVVHHVDGDRLHNVLPNLQWLTDSVHKSRHATGGRSGRARLTETDVASIRKRVSEGESQSAIAKEYGMRKQTINMAVMGHTWKHVPDWTPTLAEVASCTK